MIILTTTNGTALINQAYILAITPSEEVGLTDVFIGELCIPVKETVEQIIGIIQMKYN